MPARIIASLDNKYSFWKTEIFWKKCYNYLAFQSGKKLLLSVPMERRSFEIYKEAADIHTTKEKQQKDYF